MSDSNELEELRNKHRRNHQERLEAVKAWARYVKEQPVEVWGPQQNRIIESQVESARNSNIDIEHRLRVAEAKPDRRPE